MVGAGQIEAFVARWQGREGGQERANYQLFLLELCDLLDVPRPDPADATTETNDYVFERAVRETGRDGGVAIRRIDLYRRDAFVLEAKQSRWPRDPGASAADADRPGAQEKVVPGIDRSAGPAGPLGRRGARRGWDTLMLNARRQAEDYVRLLPAGHAPPPFLLVCDVGHCLELYANFRRDGKAYDQYPNRAGFRIYLEDLAHPEVRDTLRQVWLAPMDLDPGRIAAAVTRDIAARLAAVSRALEAAGHPAEAVAAFLTRLIFTMFAEDVGLIEAGAITRLLGDCEDDPALFPDLIAEVWRTMDTGGLSTALKVRLPCFNGTFFAAPTVLPLGREEIGELRRAAEHDWTRVEPAIFGTLLEQALDPQERRRLGAFYTPRGHVERLVAATVIEPLRDDWASVLATAERQRADGDAAGALRTVQAFHGRLCETRVLDPAVGTGNFLYITLAMIKQLEGEVLEVLTDLTGQDALPFADRTVDLHTFIGLEVNPRAAEIAGVVLWIGWLQWFRRLHGRRKLREPILDTPADIRCMDAVLDRGGATPGVPDWPAADFIVGNPPFIGGKDLRARLGGDYAEALWAAHPEMNESADYVMYWWDLAARRLAAPDSRLRRFGFVTTNSIGQVFQRRTVARHLDGPVALSIVHAIPDHPWTKATRDAAAVRIAMTVVERGRTGGVRRTVTEESGLDTDTPQIRFAQTTGRINADLSVGVDTTGVKALRANRGLCSPGVKLHGAGFIVTPGQAEALGLGRRPGLEAHIRPYRNGRDLTARPRGVMVIDLFGLDEAEVRRRFPEVYQHLLTTVRPERAANRRASYRDTWWVFGEPRRELRPALRGLTRYIATVETARHRVFQFLDAAILPDNKLVAIGSDRGWHLGVLSSHHHCVWALQTGGWLGVGNDPVYVKSRCFDPFPFPDASAADRAAIGALAEDLDAHRKRVLAEHPELTLTGLYNALEPLRAGTPVDALDPATRRVVDTGLVLILNELHDRLDAAVAAAYGWPAELSEAEVLGRLVALNLARRAEEAAGRTAWLRPDHQIPRFGTAREKAAHDRRQIEADLVGGAARRPAPGAIALAVAPPVAKRAFPHGELDQTTEVWRALIEVPGTAPVDAAALAARYRQGRRVEPKVAAILTALWRVGAVVTSADGGRIFRAPRAA